MFTTFWPNDYGRDIPIVPHGLSVITIAPVFLKFNSCACEAVKIFGIDISNVSIKHKT